MHPHDQHEAAAPSVRGLRVALAATLHCLTGCAIGEVLGIVIGTAAGLGDDQTIALAVALAFGFGYAFTLVPLLGAGIAFGRALGIALAADTLSIATMELVDNVVILAVPGAMEATLGDALFWGSLAGALVVAFLVAFPVNVWLLARGKGHALVHAHHSPAKAGRSVQRTGLRRSARARPRGTAAR